MVNLNAIVGWLGTIFLAVCGAPQAWASIRDKHSDGIKWGTILLWEGGEILMTAYVLGRFGPCRDVMPILINNGLNIVMMGIVTYYKLPKRVLLLPLSFTGSDVLDAVTHAIRRESRDEALKILDLGGEPAQKEFMAYYRSHKDNVCCLVLDEWKDKLVKDGRMERGGSFGNDN